MAGRRQERGAAAILAVLAAGALIASGCGAGDDEPVEAEPTTTGADAPPDDPPAPEEDGSATRLYFTSGEQFREVKRVLPERGSAAEVAVEALVAGPTHDERAARVEAQTQIPDGVEVQAVEVADDGTATVRLSREFLAGVQPDESQRTAAQQQELDARLGQVTYTLTQFPQVEETKVVSGGVGVEPPLNRKDYSRPERRPDSESRPRGAQSTDTRAIQRRLARLRFLPKSAVDGVGGYRTQQAVIAFQSWEGLGRDGIVGPITRAALADARKPRARGSGDEPRIEVFREKGVALVVRDDRTLRAVHVSTGAPGTATPSGTFEVFRKEKMSWSYPFQQWLPFASYFFQGIAFHEYASVPSYPASHGCVRVPEPEARWLYRFADIGTRVIVY